MGRTAGKIESLEGILSKLELEAQNLAMTRSGYFPETAKPRQCGEDATFLDRANLGTMTGDSLSTFKPVDPDRLQFVGTPSFDPTPYLDPLSQRIFNDPMSTRTAPEHCTVKPPKLRVHCSRSQKIRLFNLLDSSSRLSVHCADEVCPRYGSGLFAVGKNLELDRLILDSRGANLLEQPPNRWIMGLGSAEILTRMIVEDNEVVRCSANDLRDFYYLFRATPSRARRNVLVGPLHPKELQGLHALKEHHLKENVVYGALSSLAMGDTQAVELAQSCHLGLGLQAGIITTDNLTTLYKPVPRTSTMVGVVIDDFVTLSKVERDAQGPSEGAKLAEEMQNLYESVNLIPNKKKAFRDQSKASFWGIDLDGETGLIRGSLKRAIPLAGLVLQIVKLGVATTDLIQVVAGSLISLMIFRRRLLSLLDSLFNAIKGRGARDIFVLDGRTKSDLLSLVVLLPLAVTNMRAKPARYVGASDASNWGEAGVIAKVPRLISKELTRHSLRKSVWARLLSVSAWLRSHDLLEPSRKSRRIRFGCCWQEV